ncbi:MAG: methyltransferase domain-containing protein [Cyanobacteria bacterium]|nr:methyltransferase domain-containing protein [Cyanobacteriota bacterium]
MTPALPASSPPPNWVEANHPLGWLINRVLAVEPLRQLLFWQARRLIIRTAEGRGIAWRQRREQLQLAAEPLLAASTNPSLAVPAYYRARFHAYNQGNLCWAAACEAEQATDSMALRVWPEEPELEPAVAQLRLRRAIFSAIEPSLTGPVQRVLDLGCSVGVGTFALREWLLERQALAGGGAGGEGGVACATAEDSSAKASAQGSRQAPTVLPLVEGLDLSAEMLAVARVREAEALAASSLAALPTAAAGRSPGSAGPDVPSPREPFAPAASGTTLPPITWHHGAAEATGLPAAAYDLITLQFVCHELPQSATRAVLAEAARLLRPGGVIALVDQDPDSAVIRRLPAPIATLLKSTEPYLEDYFRLDLPAALQEAGFRNVQRSAADPRHRVLVASR